MGNKGSHPKLEADRMTYLLNNSHFKKRELRKTYKQFCKTTSNGVLTKAQFVGLYNSLYHGQFNIEFLAEHMFRVFAMNNTYSVDFEGFMKCLSVTTRGTLSEQIKWTFQLYDIDGDGSIVMSEITEIMKAA